MSGRRDGEGRPDPGRHVDPERRIGFEPERDVDARFDEALGRVASSLVSERLPQGVLDRAVGASLGLRATGDGRRLLGLGVVGAAVVVLLLAAAALAPTLLPGSSPVTPSPSPAATATPAFRTTAEIRADLERLGYTCTDGEAVAPVASGVDAVVRNSTVCTAPEDIGPLRAAVIVGESADGRVVEVHAKSDIVGFDIPAARRSVAATLAKAVAVVVPQGLGNAVATWVANNVPVVEPKGILAVDLRGYALRLERNAEGWYTLVVVSGGPG